MQELAMSLNNVRGLCIIIGVCAAVLAAGAVIFCACGKKDRLGQLVVALGFAVLACAFIFMIQGVEEIEGTDSSSRLVPYLWAVPLLFVSLVQLVRIWRSDSVKPVQFGSVSRVILTFIIVAASISQFRTLGFFVSTALMIILLMLLFGERRFLVIAGTAAFWVVFTWVVFNKVLLMSLPAGTVFASLFA
jgi:hypothetical protein